MLAVSCAAGPATAAGELGGALGLGVLGFVIWLAFVASTGFRLVRSTLAGSEEVAS